MKGHIKIYWISFALLITILPSSFASPSLSPQEVLSKESGATRVEHLEVLYDQSKFDSTGDGERVLIFKIVNENQLDALDFSALEMKGDEDTVLQVASIPDQFKQLFQRGTKFYYKNKGFKYVYVVVSESAIMLKIIWI